MVKHDPFKKEVIDPSGYKNQSSWRIVNELRKHTRLRSTDGVRRELQRKDALLIRDNEF